MGLARETMPLGHGCSRDAWERIPLRGSSDLTLTIFRNPMISVHLRIGFQPPLAMLSDCGNLANPRNGCAWANNFPGRVATYAGAVMSDNKDKMKRLPLHPSQMAGRKPVFHLYISGATPRSTEAIFNLKHVLQDLLGKDYELIVTDTYQDPEVAVAARVHTTPTLVLDYPAPIRRVIGDFSSAEKIRSILATWISNKVPGE
jgi:circadian clock protein KaiB